MNEQIVEEQVLVDYTVTSDIAGHKKNAQVPVMEAAEDIFTHVKEKGMQCAVKGTFISFSTVADLVQKLTDAVKVGFSVKVYDEVYGG